VDGPVYTSIFKSLIGIKLYEPDEYEAFQSDLAVYHDDYGDYSTNEPTMDGTASLVYLMAAKDAESIVNEKPAGKGYSYSHGAIIRGDSTRKKLALVFTGDLFAEGTGDILSTLKTHRVKASFFLTGGFYRNFGFKDEIRKMKEGGHYLGGHGNEHLLCCDWTKRDSLLITKKEFLEDLERNYARMKEFGIRKKDAPFFLPPYEWFNDSISAWTGEKGLTLISYTPGTLSHADYTTLKDRNYRDAGTILQSIKDRSKRHPNGLNGFILLMHTGAGPERPDPFHNRLQELIVFLEQEGFQLVRVDELLQGR
jgi:peptidoglycan/xylan/chitin deacetylase (PgdA/CDA1 family)